MPELTTDKVREFLGHLQGRTVTLTQLRGEFNIVRGAKSWDGIRNIMYQLAAGKERIIKPSGVKDGSYKVIKRAERVNVFGIKRERKLPVEFFFPRDFDTGMELPFADSVVLRQGDLILIAGFSNYGKTTLALNMVAENIDKNPVLMGNEFTDEAEQPRQRFLNRMDAMSEIQWTDDDGNDRFELLPVHEDFEDNIVKNKINLIDWIDLEEEPWTIKDVEKRLKLAVGDGIVVAVVQKNETSETGYGGNPSKFYTDLELLVDKHTSTESRITVGKVKESKGYISGRSWAYGIKGQGTQIYNVREVAKCHECHGFKYVKGKGACPSCLAVGWLDK